MKKAKMPLLICGVIIALVLFFWIIKAEVASSYLTDKLKVRVYMMGIKIRPTYMHISHFRISNPLESKERTAFSAKTINVNYQFNKLIGDPSVINLIEINNAFLEVELYNPLGTKSNWTKITAGLAKDKTKNREVIIQKLVINNLDIEIRGLGLTGMMGRVQNKHVDHLEFNNINSKTGFPTKELIREIFGSSGLQDYLKSLFSPQDFLQDALSPFKLFGNGDQKEKTPSEKGWGGEFLRMRMD